jgi:two-component system cell cycle response regulator DivK
MNPSQSKEFHNMAELPRTLFNGWDIAAIDDEEDSRVLIEIILMEYGAKVHTASDGEEGLSLIRSVRPKFVICDLAMPVLDGWGVVHQMKLDPALKDIPAIALSAHAMSSDRERAVAAGFHNYLTKPLNVNTFIHDLTQLLVDIPVLAEQLKVNIPETAPKI